MLKILINAYACSPDMGSEPGMAWNWVSHLAKFCELYIITEGEFRDRIEHTVRNMPYGNNLHFYYNPVSENVRRMCWNQGDWRFYRHYRKWQWKTYLMAKKICKIESIDVLHQLNMIGFREPGYLWRLSKENGVPFVWGPVDAKDKFPVAYLNGAGMKTNIFIRLKNFLTCIQLRYSNRVRQAANQASVIFAASSNSRSSFGKYMKKDTLLLNETGCEVKESPVICKKNSETFNVLWVGKMDFRKQLQLALVSVQKSNNRRIRLHIVGGGNALAYQMQAHKLGIEEQCVWHGVLSHDNVQNIMRESDLLIFTSVAEGTPHVVLEAISNHLPVICFDTCGQGDTVDDSVGRKTPLSSPVQSAKKFAKLLNQLESNRTLLKQMSDNCRKRAEELSWDNKALTMKRYYDMVVQDNWLNDIASITPPKH